MRASSASRARWKAMRAHARFRFLQTARGSGWPFRASSSPPCPSSNTGLNGTHRRADFPDTGSTRCWPRWDAQTPFLFDDTCNPTCAADTASCMRQIIAREVMQQRRMHSRGLATASDAQFRESARSRVTPDQLLAGCGALIGATATLVLATRATGAECVAPRLGRGPLHPGTALPLTPKTT